MKIIFENYAGDLTNEEKKSFLKKLKEVKYSHLDFSLRHPFGIEMHDLIFFHFQIKWKRLKLKL